MKSFISLLFITVSFIAFFVFIRPQYATMQTMHREVVDAKANLQTANELIKSRDALMTKYQSIPSTDITNIKTLLPDSVDNIRLIIQMNSLATKNGLTLLKNVDYQTDSTSSTPGTQTTQDPQTAALPYGVFTISFQTSGQYKNFLSFLSDLEKNLRLVDVTGVEFLPTQSSATQNGAPDLNYKVTLKTYWLKQ